MPLFFCNISHIIPDFSKFSCNLDFFENPIKLLFVNKSGKKPVIGIIGGIASGKTTVAAEFEKLGCGRIDADKIVHIFLDKDDIKSKIAESLGKEFLNKAGSIDTKKLAEIVFEDPSQLSKLNNILHPPVLARIERLIEQFNRLEQIKAIVLDVPLLLEVGWEKRCDYIIFVKCDLKTRLSRAQKTGIFTENHLRARENFQISLDRKVEIADNIVENNSGYAELARQVAKIFSYIVKNE